MKLFLKIFCFLFLFLLLTIPCSAAEPFVPWSDSEGYYTDYDFIVSNLVVYDTQDDRIFYVDSSNRIVRTIGDVIYSANTSVFVPVSGTIGFSGANFVFPFSGFWNDEYPNSFVSDFDIYLLINLYGTVSSSDNIPFLFGRSVISKVLYSDDSASSPFSLRLDVELVDSVRYSNASCTYIYRISYHGLPFYYDTQGYHTTTITFEWAVPNFTTSEIYSSLIDIDVGVIDARVGRSIVAEPWVPPDKPMDIWAGIGVLPDVVFPQFDDSSVTYPVSDLFQDLSDLDIVSLLLIPIGVMALGFFTFRMILWK